MSKEELLIKYYSLAVEHGHCASQYWHTDLLIWLTKLWKPKVIVDLGTYCGGSFYCFLYGLVASDNNDGFIYTVDFIDRMDKLIYANLNKNLFMHIICSSEELELSKPIDFLFIDDDSGYDHIMTVWKKHEKWVNVGGLVFFHDTHFIEQASSVVIVVKELWEKNKDRYVRLSDLGADVNGDPCGLEIWMKIK